MKRIAEKVLAWSITGVFLAGLYSLAHFIAHMDDTGILVIAGWLIWSEMAKAINKEDAKAS